MTDSSTETATHTGATNGSGAPVATTETGDKRDELRAKIEAGERRIAERNLAEDAREAARAAGDYARANPLTVLAGAIGLGIAIGLMTSPGRRAATNAATGTARTVSNATAGAARTVKSATKKRSAAAGTAIADAIVAYAAKLIDEALSAAQTGQEALEDLGDSAEAKAREFKREAAYRAGKGADRGRAVSRRTRRKAARAVRNAADRVSG